MPPMHEIEFFLYKPISNKDEFFFYAMMTK